MKVVHKQEESLASLLAQGKEAEAAGAWNDAENIYHRILRRETNHLQAIQRLVIIYRKQRSFAAELRIINKAIESFTRLYTPQTAHSKKIQMLSAKINKAFGMVDRKGKNVYEPGPIAAWKKRKAWVEKRLNQEGKVKQGGLKQ